MTVKADSPHQTSHAGQQLLFCSQRCLEKFTAEPSRYLDAGHAHGETPTVDHGAEYTCPMHPEILQIGPGTCPKCGMALEPVMPELEEEDNPEL
ncbi:heavy metal-binding domain-containing protein, partial [Stutzerimonas nitrititolerans]